MSVGETPVTDEKPNGSLRIKKAKNFLKRVNFKVSWVFLGSLPHPSAGIRTSNEVAV
jgi:hypothetical protein